MPTPSEQQSKGQMLGTELLPRELDQELSAYFYVVYLKLHFVAILNIHTSANLGKQLKS